LFTIPEKVSPYRTDGQRGVTFSSEKVRLMILAALLREDIREYRLDPGISPRNTGLRHLIMVAANGGILPEKDRKLRKMLIRKGVMIWDIPEALRNYWLHNFLGKEEEELTTIKFPWWMSSSLKEQKLFIRHLKILCMMHRYPKCDIRFVLDVCVEILEAMESGQEETKPDMELLKSAEQFGHSPTSIEITINTAWSNFTAPASINEAAEHISMSRSHTCHIVSNLQHGSEDIYKVDREWQVPMLVLDEWLIARGKVTIGMPA
jgi:hypothetical protein